MDCAASSASPATHRTLLDECRKTGFLVKRRRKGRNSRHRGPHGIASKVTAIFIDSPPTTPIMSSPLLNMSGVRKRFGATQALEGVDLAVSAGEVLALIGENGAGKSTLMKVLSGAHSPDEGRMSFDGLPYAPRHPADARRAGIAMIYQELSLALHLSVMENIALGAEPVRGPFIRREVMRQRAVEAMTELGRGDIPPDLPVWRLSVAEQQLVEIGRAVAAGSRVLVLDEPTSSLARDDVERLFDLIRRLKHRGLGIIYISHFLEEVRMICDRFIVLRDGRSVGSGVPAETPNEEIITLMVGRSVDELYPRSARSPGEALLTLEDLSGDVETRRSVTYPASRRSARHRRDHRFGTHGTPPSGLRT